MLRHILNVRIGHLAAGRFRTFEETDDDGCGAADAFLNINGAERAVERARAALHTLIAVSNSDFAFELLKNAVRTDIQTHPATGAFIAVVLQGHYILQIFHINTSFLSQYQNKVIDKR